MAEKEKSDFANNAAVSWFQEKTSAITEFYTETRHEMARVTWPTRKQVRATTIVVIVTVFFFGGFFLVADTIVNKIVTFIFDKLAKG